VLDLAPEHELARVVDYLTRNEHDWEHVDPTDEELYPDGS
jgi:hypothetical protein